MKLFCFGLGYTAKRLRDELSSSSWQFSGTRRAEGDVLFNGSEPLENAAEHLRDCTHLLISVPPNPEQIDPVLYHHKDDIENMANLKWIGYLSTTSVYGDHNGGWVDENSKTIPSTERGELRLKAERQWLALDKPVHIFRLGGIYGPARNQINAIKNSTAKKIVKKDHLFSRIHVDDICAGLKASMENPSSHKIYNLVDDRPASASDVLDFLCAEFDLPQLKGTDINDLAISSALKSFYQDNKRVKNNLVKRDLNWRPKFPSYREGYSEILTKLNERQS